ncbi:MAG: hypothetical protein M0D55_13390 [Elusimicrobiota bacterium]|nr:MAG: hypothetical protein M0D55_13390 [Elusimicrobiota bacterium]
MRRPLLLAGLLLAAACRGTVPERNAPPEQAISAILIGCRTFLPSGETRNGRLAINFESEGGRQAETYRLPLIGGENYLYLVEPGLYRITPTRSMLGSFQANMVVTIEGRQYVLPFPRELLRQHAYDIKPGKITSMGVVEATVSPALPGQKPSIKVKLDDSPQARRNVVQSLIRDMMDPRKPVEARESALAWTRALQNSLMELLAEDEQRRTYKPGQ